MKNLILYMAISVLTFACGNKTKNEESDESFRNRVAKAENALISKTSIEYNVKNILDTIDDRFTIDLKKIVGQDVQIIKDFRVVDIYENGDSTFAYIQLGDPFNEFYIDLNISKLDIKEITNNTGYRGKYNYGFLLVRISSFKKARFSLETQNYTDETPSTILSDLNVFTGKGDLIKIVPYPKMVKITNK